MNQSLMSPRRSPAWKKCLPVPAYSASLLLHFDLRFLFLHVWTRLKPCHNRKSLSTATTYIYVAKRLRFIFAGELAETFSVLVRVLHSGQYKCLSPNEFKRTVGKFKSQFSGYDQQDSQELLAFLMDGLHEDLNKVNTDVNASPLSGYCAGRLSGQMTQWPRKRRGTLAASPLSPKGYEEATMAAAAKTSLGNKT